jgi:hypothetical protein
MPPIAPSGRLRSLLRTIRAAHRRSSDEWIRRIEVPARQGRRR